MKRIGSALIGAPLLILFILKAHILLFIALILVCITLGLKEFYQLLEYQKIYCFKYLGIVLGVLLSLLFALCSPDPMILCFGLTAIIISLFLRALSLPAHALGQDIHADYMKKLNQSIGGTLIGILYVSLCLSHLILIRCMDHGRSLILFLLIVIWSCDIGAYYTGTLIGKHLLCPHISPKKTIEGSIGGLISSLLSAQLMRPFWCPQVSVVSCFLLSCCIAVGAQFGDLSESIIKRSAEVKDTGMIIPGHGGLLDRIDSLLFGAPVFFYYNYYSALIFKGR
ncbi:MAG: phosphatidate cytidylyltransferase [bacterium]